MSRAVVGLRKRRVLRGDGQAAALRLGAVLGVTSGPGLVVVSDGHRGEAAGLAKLVRGIEVVVVGWGGRGLKGDGVSAFVTGPRLPLRDGVARGVVAEGRGGAGVVGGVSPRGHAGGADRDHRGDGGGAGMGGGRRAGDAAGRGWDGGGGGGRAGNGAAHGAVGRGGGGAAGLKRRGGASSFSGPWGL